MAKVRIVTDTCSSIPDDLLVALQIITVPYYVNIEGKSYRDLVDMPRRRFYDYLLQARELPKTANPGPGEYLEAYQQAAAEGATEIISVQMTSSGSGGYQAACLGRDLARTELPRVRIEVVDTRNVAMCQGWIAIEAARLAATGATLEHVMARIDDIVPQTRILQTADTLRYLYMGGRIGRAQHLVGQLLNVKPLISMEDGVIVALGMARSRMGVYRQIVERVVAAAGKQLQIKVAYLHAAAEGEAQTLRSMVEERLRPVETLVAELSPALGVHSGPGTVGICYLRV